MTEQVQKAFDKIQDAIDDISDSLSNDDYRSLLSELEAEIEIRKMALNDL